jgi:hypothetical protein
MTGIFQSGHRIAIISCVMTLLVTSYFHRGFSEVLKLLAVFSIGALFLILGSGTLFNLPLTAQRTLTFLPGHWDPGVLHDAQASSEWRINMWKRAWEGDLWIKNKVLGDGFGFSKHDLDALQQGKSLGNFTDDADGQLLTGGFHSGPLSTIRYVGVVGLVFFYVLMGYMAVFSYKLIRRSKGTPFFTLSMYFAFNNIISPVLFTFVFGAFEGALPSTIIMAGLLNLLNQSLNDYEEENRNSRRSQFDSPGLQSFPQPKFTPPALAGV